MPRPTYPNIPVPNTLRARWLADLVDQGAFTHGGLLSRPVVDPDTKECVPPETTAPTPEQRARARWRRYARKNRDRRARYMREWKARRKAVAS